jgi:hypothetical protein
MSITGKHTCFVLTTASFGVRKYSATEEIPCFDIKSDRKYSATEEIPCFDIKSDVSVLLANETDTRLSF